MGFIFPKTPSMPPPPPDTSAADAEKAAEAKRKLNLEMARRQGRASTIVSGALGDTTEPAIRKATLG